MTRVQYEHQLEDLRASVVAMSSMVDKAIGRAMEALTHQDIALARSVIDGDAEINAMRWAVEDQALTIIATQAPMARDLRIVVSAISIVTDLERMADHAAGIAKIAIDTANEPPLKPLMDLPRMSEIARRMLSDAISAYIANDADAALEIAGRDDELDVLYNQIYRELLTYMMADPGTINRATHLLWVAHNLERIGDRVTNICERVLFSVRGSVTEMNMTVR